ncbi:MAG: hypothetical protein ACR2NP_04915, partial [Pirellulaceae bacterium]
MVYKVPVADRREEFRARIAVMLALFAQLFVAASGMAMQSPASRIPGAIESPTRAIDNLVASEDWTRAAQMAAALTDSPQRGYVHFVQTSSNSIETWWPADDFLQLHLEMLLARHPPLLTQWRSQVDPRASSLFASAIRNNAWMELDQLVRKYRFA